MQVKIVATFQEWINLPTHLQSGLLQEIQVSKDALISSLTKQLLQILFAFNRLYFGLSYSVLICQMCLIHFKSDFMFPIQSSLLKYE